MNGLFCFSVVCNLIGAVPAAQAIPARPAGGRYYPYRELPFSQPKILRHRILRYFKLVIDFSNARRFNPSIIKHWEIVPASRQAGEIFAGLLISFLIIEAPMNK
ncbi:hypothetical protein BEL04_22040 [Mucilaginibacter sp. PPCGB 2223]|uniref:hypothetical protein n=1 Tax=Mucilaginibacter sp. PPCGB 2223 TaxID=1886027 RepID=UPI000824E733|nr:hypothetical protein [Mucilaginibacter sp. PPCGB 2223]OCX50465.1 hypothetical protein BEL04_22040 [Mucilaginibacter sp. PPCGB 2223]